MAVNVQPCLGMDYEATTPPEMKHQKLRDVQSNNTARNEASETSRCSKQHTARNQASETSRCSQQQHCQK